MEKKKFDYWLAERQNIIEWPWNKPAAPEQPAAPVDNGPKQPSEIYNNPDVLRYFGEIAQHLGLNSQLEKIDNRGKVVGHYEDGHLPQNIYQAFLRFIAGHVLGGGDNKSFLWISYHDAAQIIDFLDSVRRPGSQHSIAEEMHVEDPKSLAYWVQTKVPVHQNMRYQHGYNNDAASYDSRRRNIKGGRPNLMDYPELAELHHAIVELIVYANRRGDITSAKRPSGWRPYIKQLIDSTKRAFPGDVRSASLGIMSSEGPPETNQEQPQAPNPAQTGDRTGTTRTSS